MLKQEENYVDLVFTNPNLFCKEGIFKIYINSTKKVPSNFILLKKGEYSLYKQLRGNK